jgi:hypothetical protein
MARLLAAFLLLAQAQAENPDMKYKPELGISINKPPKLEEWGFKDKGFWTGAHVSVAHKVDSLTIDILGEAPPESAGNNAAYWDVKGSLENHWGSVTNQAAFQDAKRIDFKQARLPGNGAGGVNAWHLNGTFNLNGTPTEYRAWCFVGKESKVVYIVTMACDEGMYKKHQRVVDFILGSIRCWKRPKS